MPRTIRPEEGQPDPKWLMPDEMWERVAPLLPAPKPKGKGTAGGRSHVDYRRTMNAIFYILRTGSQWKSLPRSLGSGSTAHDYFQQWVRAGVFEKPWKAGLAEYDVCKGIEWQWQSLDGAMTKAPLAARRLAPTRRTEASQGPSGRD